MKKIKLFDAFAGIGALHTAFKNIGVETEITGVSEIDPDSIIAYAAIHDFDVKSVKLLEEKEMKDYLIKRNIGWDFQKQKSSIPRMKKEKLKLLYQSTVAIKNYGDVTLLNPNEVPDFDIFNFSFPCFIAGTLVLTDKGYKKIEDIEKCDLVLTHTNTYQKVVKSMTNKAKNIYKLSTMCSEDLFVTEEHPFYVRERHMIYNNNLPKRKRGRGSERKFSEPQWIKTKDLSKNYYVGIAINQKSELPRWDGAIVNSTWKKYGNKKLLNNIHDYFNNKDFWWIVGRYMGDGWVKNCIDCKGTDIYDLYICCAKNELSEITNVLDNLNIINNDFKYKYYEDNATYRIRISNVEFSKYLQQFGKGAFNKKLTGDIINLPKDLLESFLVGYMSADGCFTNKRFKATSISKELIYGIGQCVAKVYNRPYSIYTTKRKSNCVIEGRLVNQKDSYNITWKNDINTQDQAFYEDGYIWCPIRGLEEEEYNGFVYNMEVENDNSYTVNNIIVHNCTDLSGAGKQEGMTYDDGSPTRSGLYIYGISLVKEKKPKYIMIENVKALITKKFIGDFYKIVNELEEIGYICYYPKNDKGLPKCLNAKDYGIPQNRERIFVICIRKDIDDSKFEFPKGFNNGVRLKHILENHVDEKYYLNKRLIDVLNEKEFDDSITGVSNNPCSREYNGFKEICPTLCARDYKDPKLVQIGTLDMKGNDCIRRVYSSDGISPTLTTMRGGNTEPKVICEHRTDEGLRFFKDNVCGAKRTTDSCGDKRVIEIPLKSTKFTKIKNPYDIVNEYLQNNEFSEPIALDEQNKCIREDFRVGTLTTDGSSPKKNNRVVINSKYYCSDKEESPSPELVGGIGDINFGKQYRQGNRIYDSEKTAMCLMSQPVGNTGGFSYLYQIENYRIRKLTPLECYRLMGFLDEAFYKAKSVGISDSQLYRQAGNSIVVNVLESIFKNLFILS